MKFSEWTKRADSHVVDNAAGDNYEQLPHTAKDCIDSAVDRFIKFCKAHVSGSLPLSEKYFESKGFKFVDMMFGNVPMRYWRKDKLIVRKTETGWVMDLFNDKESHIEVPFDSVEKFEAFTDILISGNDR